MTIQPDKKIFAAGRFFGINNVTNPTPVRPGLMQDMSLNIKRATKSIYGENQGAADVGGGELDVTGKITYGATNARIFSDLLFGIGSTTGQNLEADNELVTVTTHVATVANAATWTTDLGVVNPSTGLRYQRVASSPVSGVSYSVAAGVYTFATGETATAVKISYLYTPTVNTTGETLTVTNQPMGKVNDFTSIMVLPWTDNTNTTWQDVITLNSCIVSEADLPTKQADYGKPTAAFTAAFDQNDTLGTFAFAKAA